MKSKLFLSLSLLTAVFSMNANTTEVSEGAQIVSRFSHVADAVKAKVTPFVANVKANPGLYAKVTGLIVAPAALGATVYGLDKAYNNYMHPEAVTPTRFERVKAQVQKGYNSSLTFVKANQKPVGAVAAVAALGLLGYKMYQNKEAIFGKSQAVQANTVQAEEKPVVHIFRQRARD